MKTIIHTPNAPEPIGPYSQAVMAYGVLYTSGQIAIDPSTGHLNMPNIEAETTQVMHNLQAVLEAAGMGFEHVVKTTIFLNDMADFAKVNAVYATYFDPAMAPARETVAVKTLPREVNVEISMIATK
ncbi:MAG: reactive intermediate/imine deaminase [Flavobacterium sp. BFFFF2]|jgi:2-iminobutanoate/2-iminopropanoate deaminase|nr:MAG: reactive intermediate/imine deaminase [Flavobacterium sp. BFFFF2]